LDKNALLRHVLEAARDADYDTVSSDMVPGHQMKVTITQAAIISLGIVELWVEFCVPASNGMAVGTHIFHLKIDNDSKLELHQTYGRILVSKT
jgi:hypothetical protein